MPTDLLASSRSSASLKIVALLSDYLTSQGVDFEAVAAAAGFSARRLGHDAAPTLGMLRLLEESARACRDDANGVHLACSRRMDLAPLLEHISLNSPTVAHALRARVRFFRLVTDACHIDLVETSDGARYCWRFPAKLQPRRQLSGYTTTALVEKIRSLTSEDWRPIEVRFEHGAPKNAAAYREALGNNLVFNSIETSVLIDHQTLNRPIAGANPELYTELQTYACLVLGLKPLTGNSVEERVADLVAQRIGTGSISEQEIARSLGMTVRGMQRELLSHNTSFRHVVEHTRIDLARHYLVNTGVPLTDVALALGFSELSAFSRAAKQWFGSTPTEIRKKTTILR